MILLILLTSYYPRKKGLVAGLVIGAFGLGGAIFGLVAQAIINPNN